MIYYVRHGETCLNARGFMCGDCDVPLTENGTIQARKLAEELRGVRFDTAYCSPLLRARQTADEILKFHPGLKLIVDDRLHERSDGDLEGLQMKFYPFLADRWKTGFDYKKYNYESPEHVFARVRDFVEEIKPFQDEKNVLVVAHNGISRVMSALERGLGPNEDLSAFGMRNASVRVLKF